MYITYGMFHVQPHMYHILISIVICRGLKTPYNYYQRYIVFNSTKYHCTVYAVKHHYGLPTHTCMCSHQFQFIVFTQCQFINSFSVSCSFVVTKQQKQENLYTCEWLPTEECVLWVYCTHLEQDTGLKMGTVT